MLGTAGASDVTLTRVKPKRPLEPERLVEHFAPLRAGAGRFASRWRRLNR